MARVYAVKEFKTNDYHDNGKLVGYFSTLNKAYEAAKAVCPEAQEAYQSDGFRSFHNPRKEVYISQQEQDCFLLNAGKYVQLDTIRM